MVLGDTDAFGMVPHWVFGGVTPSGGVRFFFSSVTASYSLAGAGVLLFVHIF
jgi:hypothetical protein